MLFIMSKIHDIGNFSTPPAGFIVDKPEVDLPKKITISSDETSVNGSVTTPETEETEVKEGQNNPLRKRKGLRRAENANPHAYWGQITSQQMHLIHDFRTGVLADKQEFLNQILALEKQKLDKRVEAGQITAEQEQQKIEKFTAWINKTVL